MEMINLVKVVHDGSGNNKPYTFKLASWSHHDEPLKERTKVLIKDRNGIHTGVCVSESFCVSENVVENFTDGQPLTGVVIGIVLDPYEYSDLQHVAGFITNVGKRPEELKMTVSPL